MTTSGSPARSTSRIEVGDSALLVALAGPGNDRLKLIELELGIDVSLRGSTILLEGPASQVARAERFFAEASRLAEKGVALPTNDVARALRWLEQEPNGHLSDILGESVVTGAGRKSIGPRGAAQRAYVDAIKSRDLTFGVGPAGTGKTYLAMACAIAALTARQVKRIVLTRPAVEAGEKLGFLPGDLTEKVDPYLRPLYDALADILDVDRARGLITRGAIEVAPLAFMRGRTLSDSFVILDEAQNTTSEQMRMFLTRLGFDSKAVVTGDVTQVDLPHGRKSGLSEAIELLEGVDGISFCRFSDIDVVRHPLVQKIVRAYEARDAARERGEYGGERERRDRT